MLEWIVLVFISCCVLLVLAISRIHSDAAREVGFAEGIDDAAIGTAFNAIQNLPQFKLVRGMIIKHVNKPKIDAPLSTGSQLLDLGCGTGHLLRTIRDEISHGELPPMELHGIDLGSESVRICKESFAREGMLDIDIRQGEGANMPYDDGSMTVVVTSLSLHHWIDPARVFDDIYRVLRPGGLLVLFDMKRDCPRGWHWILRFVTTVIVPKALRKAREPLGSLLASYTREEIRGILSGTRWAGHQEVFSDALFAQVLEIKK